MPRLLIDLSPLDCDVLTGVERRAAEVAARIPAHLDSGWEVSNLAHGPLPRAPGLAVECPAAGLPRPVWRRTVLPRSARRGGADVLLSFVLHAPRVPGAVTIRTIHDVPASPRGRRLRLLRRDLPTICVSEATRTDLARVGELQSPIRVIHNGVDERFFDIERSAPEELAVVIGTMRPRRNPDVVAAAAEIVAGRRPGFRLIWVGAYHGEQWPGIEMAGALADDRVDELLARAGVLISPSSHEGFGIPVLEGLAAGLPVVAADCPAVREVAGAHSIPYPPRDAAALAAAIERALDGAGTRAGPDSPAAAGRDHARAFSWDRCAREHAELVLELHTERKRIESR